MMNTKETSKKNNYLFRSQKGLNKKIVTDISQQKNEPGWMTDFRLQALEIFEQKPMTTWGADLSHLDPYDIYKWMMDNKWTGTLKDAFRKTYL